MTGTARTDHDTWDLRSGVGTTATMVAAARAVASRQLNPLIDDPFAGPLVKAVGIKPLIRLVEDSPAETDVIGDGLSLQPMVDAFAVRTRFFDDFLMAATDAGIRQVVILAAGLDSRAYRLSWRSDSVVFELDLPAVLEFKTRELSRLGVRPNVHHRSVAADLRDDWPTILRDNDFDDSKPTAWIAEGLLMYLPLDAQDRLFDSIYELSSPGSRLATEYHRNESVEVSQRIVSDRRWTAHGLDVNTAGLIYQGRRRPVSDHLASQGWTVSEEDRRDLFELYGLIPHDDDLPMLDMVAVTASLQ